MNPQDSKDLAETFTGTVMYMSPERLAGKYYSYPSDIWSFGLSIATLALGKFPFDSKKGFWGIIGVLNNNPVPKLPEDEYSSDACDFVAQCLRKDSSKRMSTANLLRHSFLRQVSGGMALVGLARFLLMTHPWYNGGYGSHLQFINTAPLVCTAGMRPRYIFEIICTHN